MSSKIRWEDSKTVWVNGKMWKYVYSTYSMQSIISRETRRWLNTLNILPSVTKKWHFQLVRLLILMRHPHEGWKSLSLLKRRKICWLIDFFSWVIYSKKGRRIFNNRYNQRLNHYWLFTHTIFVKYKYIITRM